MSPVGVFLLFGAVMASLAGTSLVWRGTALDLIWALRPRAFQELAPLGKAVGIAFLLLGVALLLAGIGWFKRRLWGWWLAVVMVATQVLGGLVHVFLGRVLEGATGIAIAGALLFYLLRPEIRAGFLNGVPNAR